MKNGGKRAGAGRPKGKPNKFTASVKQAFADAFDNMGGVKALTEWGKTNPTDFYKLYSKLIPTDITTNGESIYEVLIGSSQEN